MTLKICEKNNAARRIAQILSGNKQRTEKKYNRPYYTFEKEGNTFDIIGLRGHIVALDFPNEYNQWQRVDPRELIEVEPETVNTEWNIIRALRSLHKGHEEVIVATDYDREGELIGKEALDVIRKGEEDLRINRVKFSSLTPTEIQRSFAEPSEMDWNLAESAYARQHLDLVWGASLTRFISLASNRLGYDFLSVGRVQTPTLALLVDREKQIEAFIPKKYWLLKADMKKGETFLAKHSKGRFDTLEETQAILDRTSGISTARVAELGSTDSYQRPPAPFNTTSFLRDITKLGLTASRAMSVAEDLYTRGFISYPRTDNTVYPNGLDLKGLLEMFSPHPVYGDYAEEILGSGKLSPTRGKKQATDHPPIHPTQLPGENDLKGEAGKVYDLIARRFFATLGKSCRVRKGKVDFDVGGEIFQTKSLKILFLGWRRYYTLDRVKEKSLPELEKGENIEVIRVYSEEKETKPPNRYTQGSLISEMDKLGLGTKSTRHEIIKKLMDREFINTSPLSPTLTGKAVIEAMKKYSELITKPEMTQKLEEDMDGISLGKMKIEDVIKESRKMLSDIFDVLDKNRKDIGDSIKLALEEERVLGSCPKCGKDISVRESRRGKRFASCVGYPKCRNSYPLPQRGRIDAKGDACPVCKAPIIRILRKRKKPWKLCINMGCEYNNNNG